jgi:hypothetical protein
MEGSLNIHRSSVYTSLKTKAISSPVDGTFRSKVRKTKDR